MNGAYAGSVKRLVSPYGRHPASAGNQVGSQYLAGTYDLRRLARLVCEPLDVVETVTFRGQLDYMAGLSARVKHVGRPPPFQVCPRCLLDDELVPLLFILPGARVCARHGIVLVRTCRCGSPLRPWATRQQRSPFTCQACGWPMEALATEYATLAERVEQRRRDHAYEILLQAGRAGPAAVQLLAFFAAPARWTNDAFALPHAADERRWWGRSLEAMASFLLQRGIAPERVLELMPEPEAPASPCRHPACARCGSAESIRLLGARREEWESYCEWCGTMYLGDRMVAAYLPGHGDGRLSEFSVREAAASLARWREQLVGACRAHPDPRVSRRELLALAGVPNRANLFAEGLGLAEVLDEFRHDAPAWGRRTRFSSPSATRRTSSDP
jgi:hypothetical protein